MGPTAPGQPFQPRRTASWTTIRTSVGALGVITVFALAGCSSGTGEEPEADVPVGATSAPTTPPGDDAPSEEPSGGSESPAGEPATTDVIRYGLGDTFTAGDTFFGVFDITYVGIAKTGELDDGEVGCFAVLVEATLQEMPADNEDPEIGGPMNNVLDANGDKAADNFSSECPPDSFLRENGYPSRYDIEWVAGTPTKLAIATLTIPVDSMDSVDSVDIDPTKKSVLDFEVTESW